MCLESSVFRASIHTFKVHGLMCSCLSSKAAGLGHLHIRGHRHCALNASLVTLDWVIGEAIKSSHIHITTECSHHCFHYPSLHTICMCIYIYMCVCVWKQDDK